MTDVIQAIFRGYIQKTSISQSMQIFLEILQQRLDVDYLYFALRDKRRNANTSILFDYYSNEKWKRIDIEKSFFFSEKLSNISKNHYITIDDVQILLLEDTHKIYAEEDIHGEFSRFDPVFGSIMVMDLFEIGKYFSVRIGVRAKTPGRYTLQDAKIFHSFYYPAYELAKTIVENKGENIYSAEEAAVFRPLSGKQMFELCRSLSSLQETLRSVSSSESNILILGETGTGKDVLARAIHETSSYLGGPFVSINCGALYGNLLDSELFGYEKGAFTGAYAQHKGIFEQGNGGTVFLNEIGELSLMAQSKLLTVLDTHSIRRIGSQRSIDLQFRLICATNRNLPELVKKKRFRDDLWFRINTFQLVLPALRERKEDIIPIAEYYIALYADSMKLGYRPVLSDTMKIKLLKKRWQGNIRELRNWVERACLRTKMTGSRFLSMPIEQIYTIDEEYHPAKNGSLYDKEKQIIESALADCNGKIEGKNSAAEQLGLKGTTLRAKMRKLGIPFPHSKQ